MDKNFKALLETFQNDWGNVVRAESLERLQDAYTNSESSREELFTWVFQSVEDEDKQADYFEIIGKTETKMWEDVGEIPIFDTEFDVYDSFDEYEGYYQRYGCMTPEFVISWDNQNILFDDGDGNIEIVARPDVLMDGID